MTSSTKLITYCEPLQRSKPYKKATLVRVTYEHCRSKSVFLQQIFTYFDGLQDQSQGQNPTFEHGLSKFLSFSSQTVLERERERETEMMMDSFADYLFDNFFLPSMYCTYIHSFPAFSMLFFTHLVDLVKAVGAKTPQPISASFSAPPIENAVGTPARLSTLRRDCLARDHNRCVITRAFNLTEAIEREKQDPSNFKDDDGLPLEREEFALLEVAHIIPHSIMSATIVDGQPQLVCEKSMLLQVEILQL